MPAAVIAAVMAGHVHALAVVELAVAGALVAWAPRLAAKAAPYAVLALAVFGLMLAKSYHDGFNNQVLYGLVLAGSSSWRTRLVLPEAALFLVLGLWLLVVVRAPGAGPGPGAGRALAGPPPWRDRARPGPAPDPGHLAGHAAAQAGVERRLATFDGILAVSSPPGGPTIVVIEVPCALSSAKTSSC